MLIILKVIINTLFFTYGDLMNETDRMTVISFDETYVSNKICFEKKSELVIGPHKCVQTVMARGI